MRAIKFYTAVFPRICKLKWCPLIQSLCVKVHLNHVFGACTIGIAVLDGRVLSSTSLD